MKKVAVTGHPHRHRILAVLSLSLLIVVIDNTILNTALPTLSRDLGAGTGQLQWIVDAYTLAFAALVILAGALGDRYGRRRSLMLGLGLFAAGSTAAAVSGSPGELIIFRALMGVGAAFVMPATLSVISAVFPAEERPMAIGIWAAMAGGGVVIGPILGGFLLEHFSWSSVFWVNVPLALLALVAAGWTVPALRGTRHRGSLDLIGAALLALAMVVFVDAIIEGPARGWLALRTLAGAGLAVSLLAAFIVRELRVDDPLVDVRIFARRAFTAATSSVAFSFFALYGSLFALTQYMQLVKGYSPLTAGLAALPFAGAMLIASPSSSFFARRFGARVVLPAGLVTMGTGLVLAAQLEPQTGYGYIAFAVSLIGAGLGLTLASASESIIGSLPTRQAGVGSAVNETVQELGGTLGVAVIGSLVTSRFRFAMDSSALPAAVTERAHNSVAAAEAGAVRSGPLAEQAVGVVHDAFTAAMTTGFALAAVAVFAAALLAAVFLPRRRDPVSAEGSESRGDETLPVEV